MLFRIVNRFSFLFSAVQKIGLQARVRSWEVVLWIFPSLISDHTGLGMRTQLHIKADTNKRGGGGGGGGEQDHWRYGEQMFSHQRDGNKKRGQCCGGSKHYFMHCLEGNNSMRQ